jgi:hypothetical protein
LEEVMSKRSIALALALSFVLGIGSVFLWRSCGKHDERGTAVEKIPQLVADPNKNLAELVVDNYREYRGNSVRWSGVYFGCVFGAAALSALAALLLKLSALDGYPRIQKDLPAIFATVSALLITVSTSGDFSRKWQANRLAASDMENLAYDLLPQSKAKDISDLIQKIQAINTARNLSIVGTDKTLPKPLATPTPPRTIESTPGPSPSKPSGS